MAAPQQMGLGEYCGSSITRRQTDRFVVTENQFRAGKIPLHEHAYAHFTYVVRGGFTESYGDQPFECGEGSLLIVPAGQSHRDTVWDSGAHTLSVELSRPLAMRLSEVSPVFAKPRVLSETRIRLRADQLLSEFRSFDAASLYAIESIALEIIVLAARREGQVDACGPRWLAGVMDELHRNYAEDVTLTGIAQFAGVHETHLARTFRRVHGCTVGEYVRWLRLEAAKKLLVSDRSVAEIACEVGFYDQAHFSRAFKKEFGLSPTAFRAARGS